MLDSSDLEFKGLSLKTTVSTVVKEKFIFCVKVVHIRNHKRTRNPGSVWAQLEIKYCLQQDLRVNLTHCLITPKGKA